jgi:hypothetical protein
LKKKVFNLSFFTHLLTHFYCNLFVKVLEREEMGSEVKTVEPSLFAEGTDGKFK